MLSNKSVLMFTDNTQVMSMLSKGKSSNSACMAWIREIFWICVIYNIKLNPRYVNTKCNLVADTLSRMLYVSYYTKKHRGGCTRVLLRPGSLITNRARSVRLVIRD